MMNELGDLDQLENLLRGATEPGALAEVDLDRARELLGDDAAQQPRDGWPSWPKMLEEAGLDRAARRAASSSPRRASAGSGRTRWPSCSRSSRKDKVGQHEIDRLGVGHERTYETKPYEFGDPFNLSIERTIRNAIARSGGRHARPPARPTTSRSSRPSSRSGRRPC